MAGVRGRPIAQRPTRPRPHGDTVSRTIHPLRACASVGGTAAVAAIALRVATPFDHATWLAAYLLLVGCAAPTLLAIGEARLLGEPPRGEGAALVAGAWLLGTIAVPVGVLTDVRLPVVAGAAALILALGSLTLRAFGLDALPAADASPAARHLHASVIAFMTASTVVGVLLAWASPWL